MSNSYHYFASCPKGLEGLLADELQALGGDEIKQSVGGVRFAGPLEAAYRACLWSRLANRILLPLDSFDVRHQEDLYQGVQRIDWLTHMRSSGSLLVDFVGTDRCIRNSHFGAQKVKDAIVDQVRARAGSRPRVDKQTPDIRIHVRLDRGKAQVSLDLSGASLHRRGYRLKGGAAPLKENLAAALLYRSGWPELAAAGGSLVDPMCGSGTLLIEAALIACDIAPGSLRQRFGFEYWLGHEVETWRQLRAEAQERAERGRQQVSARIFGYDGHPGIIGPARDNAARAGVAELIQVRAQELADLRRPQVKGEGLLLTNPPYGERLSDMPVLVHLYRHLGLRLKEEFAGWRAGVFTGNPDLGKKMGVRARKQYKFFNGPIESRLLLFQVEPAYFVEERNADAPAVDAAPVQVSAGGEMFANRLKKNLRQLGRWAAKQHIECYRLYDADMPEYALAVDMYRDWVHVQEYAAPPSVDPQKAQERLQEALAAIPGVLQVPPERLVLKQRRRQQGSEQYQKQAMRKEFMEVSEGGCRLLVNLHDYLDTGLFLDHRPARLRLQREAKGKRFLNLFCYTGAATAHAALGGASQTTSVDMSATYLEWARKNLALNGFSEGRHRFVQADCLNWLKTCEERFELIFLDPPTFSNSKRMLDTLDIQRDHVALIQAAARLLTRDGVLLFSNNYRRFKMDQAALDGLLLKEITPQTIDRDFQRNPRIHVCWEIRRD